MDRLIIVRTDRHFNPLGKLVSFPIECFLGDSLDYLHFEKNLGRLKSKVTNFGYLHRKHRVKKGGAQ